MFTEKLTPTMHPQAFGAKERELDIEKAKTIFNEEEVNLLKDILFFDEVADIRVPNNKGGTKPEKIHLDIFQLGMYYYVIGGVNLMKREQAAIDNAIKNYPNARIFINDNIAVYQARIDFAKAIMLKYEPTLDQRIFE
jgi:hypothetical protein